MLDSVSVQYIDLMLVLVVGYVIGRMVGHFVQLHNERKWVDCLERLNTFGYRP